MLNLKGGSILVAYTLGHSNRSFDEFLELLRINGVSSIADIRRWPSSSSNPHFNSQYIRLRLKEEGIEYEWLGDRLGGYRKFSKDVKDIGMAGCFRSEGFRAYATYVTNIKEAIDAVFYLANIAKSRKIVVMCSEKIPWRCHRKIVADWLIALGFKVIHIIDENKAILHRLSKCAKVVEGKLTYV